MKKGIHIETYGCQMNDYESDRTYRLFHDQFGYEWIDDPVEADLVIYNTCSIREKADQKFYSSLGRLRAGKLSRPEMIVAVGGCLAQSEGAEIQRRAPYVDIVFGTHQWTQLPFLVKNAEMERRRALEIDFYGWKDYSFLPYRSSKLSHPVSELVTVQNGCDKFCTFCLVPFTRGRELSRPVPEILGEIQSLVDQGVREVILLGQNVNAYGKDRRGEISFGELLNRVAEVKGLDRVRYMTSHPAEFSTELVDSIADNPKICEHLHLPLQSGSDNVLERMNRSYGIRDYRELVHYLQKKIPNLSLTTDIIVGFPSENEEDFERTLDALREFEFEDSFSFLYSPRPHTKAAKWAAEFVSEPIASERLARYQMLQREIHRKKTEAYVGRTAEVLVEGNAKSGDGWLAGKTRTNRTVNFQGPSEWIGKLKEVRITEAASHTLRADLSHQREVGCSSR